ncbi:MAG: UDP-galactopyranose mutase [Gammaproteobacteria bacterium HGW-Gammaproteobacteria-3]|nr:MAG: UDP-galactopyranose mutase [Gammaproteobacteria bacterium HGW-Gammaproteobacteria-3]
MYDTIIVGAGFAGAVLAERLASQKQQRVLVIDKRRHTGGNCHDSYDGHGVLVHRYGPHLFHTSNRAVFQYLSQFTDWHHYEHSVLAYIDGQKVPVPFNLNTLSALFPASLAQSLENKLIGRYGYGTKVPILTLRAEDDPELKFLADFIYDKMFVNYTAKQWGCKPEDIAPEVTARVPVHISRDNRYFQDAYQALPKHGYSKLFDALLDHPAISVLLNTDYKQVLTIDFEREAMTAFGAPFNGNLIYTGPIDELFGYRLGSLPYRSLQFQFEHFNEAFFQEATTVNYPNNHDFTRITEFKRASGQKVDGTTILKEFPQDYDPQDSTRNIPYYPVFTDNNTALYRQYRALAESFGRLILVGRLAEYRYYDMDDIVERALQVFADEFA